MKSPKALCFRIVRTSFRLSVLILFVFSATAYPIDTIFTIGVTTHVECFNDNDGFIGYMVWQPYWIERKS